MQRNTRHWLINKKMMILNRIMISKERVLIKERERERESPPYPSHSLAKINYCDITFQLLLRLPLTSHWSVNRRCCILYEGCLLYYIFINNRKSPYYFSKYSPLRSKHFCMRLNQLSKHFWHSDWGTRISKTCILNASSASSGVQKRWPLILFLCTGEKKKSFGAKSALYGGWLIKSMFWMLKNAVVWADVMHSERINRFFWCRKTLTSHFIVLRKWIKRSYSVPS